MDFKDTHMTLLEEAQRQAQFIEKHFPAERKALVRNEDFFNGEQEQYIPKVGKETQAQWNEREKLVINFTRPIIEKKAGIYEGHATRTVVDNENYDTIMQEVWKDKHGTFQKIDLQAELAGFSCVKIYFEPELEKVFYKPISAQFVFPLVNADTDEIIAVCLRWEKWIIVGGKEKKVIYDQIWTNTEYQEYEDNKPLGVPIEHLYGCLPFVFFFASERDREFYMPPASNDVVKQNQQINVMLSDLRHVCRYQSYAILKITNCDFDAKGRMKIDKVDVGASKMVGLGKDQDMKYESPEAAIEELFKICVFLIDKIFETSQVPAVCIAPSLTSASGISLEIQWYPISTYLQKKRSSYRQSEKELCDKTIIIIENQNGRQDIQDYTFEVDFEEKQMPTSEKEQRETDKFDIELGLATAVDLLMRINPDLDEKAAEKAIRENLELTKDLFAISTSLSEEENADLEKKIKSAFVVEEGVEE